jgi:endonuclease/exonuclease/phosphatase family metal-dependent hydrolase
MSEVYVQQHVYIMNIYVAPFTSALTIIETISTTKVQMVHSDYILIIIGDFNIDIHANSQRSKQLIDYMHSQQLQEITNKSTPKMETQIDHIWTNLDFDHCEVSILDVYWSDHDMIHALLHLI